MLLLLFSGSPAVNIVLAGVASAEAFGAASVVAVENLAGAASSEALGAPSVAAAETLSGVGSAEAFGAPAVVAVETLSGVASAESLGAVAVTASEALSGVASSEALGTPAVVAVESLSGVASAETFGSSAVQATVGAAGVLTGEAVGAPVVDNTGAILLAGVGSSEILGNLTLTVNVSEQGVASGEAVGAPTVSFASTASDGSSTARRRWLIEYYEREFAAAELRRTEQEARVVTQRVRTSSRTLKAPHEDAQDAQLLRELRERSKTFSDRLSQTQKSLAVLEQRKALVLPSEPIKLLAVRDMKKLRRQREEDEMILALIDHL